MRQFVTATAIAAAAIAMPAIAGAQEAQKGKASFIGADGKEIGTAELTGTSSGVLIGIEIEDLPASQWVAFHVHQTGTCDHAGGHESAGGHFNPTDAKHGYMAEGGPHAGDMPNQYVPADGTLRAQVFNSAVTLEGGDAAIKGRALMIHEKADDYEGQPSGNAGKRLACAVIE
jgi:superoxide dismutase, Cu-Zn family